MSLAYYCFCYGEKTPKLFLPDQKNLMLGSAINGAPADFIRDDAGENLSRLNSIFGQSAGLYWMWKNAQEEYIGAMTYRLFWNDEEIRNNLDKNTLIVPKEKDVNTAIKGSVGSRINIEQHFSWCHGSTGLSLLYGLVNMTDRLIKPDMLKCLKTDQHLIPFNMFVAHRDVFHRVCEILFDITFAYYNEYSYLFDTIETAVGQARILDFLSERILHCIYKNINYFLPDIKIYQADVTDIPH
jgi:hypothetical protein